LTPSSAVSSWQPGDHGARYVRTLKVFGNSRAAEGLAQASALRTAAQAACPRQARRADQRAQFATELTRADSGALVILARAGAIGWPVGATGLLAPASWAIAAFLVLNTLGNLASKSRLEKTVFAATTAALAVLSAYVALS
jgi:hypothetical protein